MAEPAEAYDQIFNHTLPDNSVDHECLAKTLETILPIKLNAEEVF